MEPQQEGITRALTPGEVNLARSYRVCVWNAVWLITMSLWRGRS